MPFYLVFCSESKKRSTGCALRSTGFLNSAPSSLSYDSLKSHTPNPTKTPIFDP